MCDNGQKENKKCCKDIDLGPVNSILEESVGQKGMLIPILQKSQKVYGYLPEPVMERIAEKLNISASEVFGVATFFAQFYFEPRGKHVIRICRGTACHVKGATKILDAVKEKLGVEVGESTSDMKYVVEGVACIGACGIEPVLMIDDKTYGEVTVTETQEAIENFVPTEEEE